MSTEVLRCTIVAALRAEVAPRLLAMRDIEVLVTGPGWTWRTAPSLSGSHAPVLITGACGALSNGRRLGSLVLPEVVWGARGWQPEVALSDRLERHALALAIGLAREALVEARTVVAGKEERESLGRDTGATFVDNESSRIAAAAEGAGRPWAVLRYVTDTPEHPLDWLPVLLGGWPEREPSSSALAAALLGKPGHLPRMLRLARAALRGRADVARIVTRVLQAGRSPHGASTGAPTNRGRLA